MIDEELKEMIEQELPDDLPVIFISSVAQKGLTELKDMLWNIISRED
jgi:GTP-binding protein